VIARKLWVLGLGILIIGFSSSVTAEVPEIGHKAQEFRLSTPDGHPLGLSEFTAKGTVVLVVLRGFPGYQCPYCQKQVHDFLVNGDKFAAAGAEVLLVYPGPPADLDQRAKEFLVKENPLPANVHLVIDPDYAFTDRYGLRWDAPHETAYPSTFLIDGQGKVFFRKVSHEHGDRTTAEDVLGELERDKAAHSH
jgi:peroxiredoxin